MSFLHLSLAAIDTIFLLLCSSPRLLEATQRRTLGVSVPSKTHRLSISPLNTMATVYLRQSLRLVCSYRRLTDSELKHAKELVRSLQYHETIGSTLWSFKFATNAYYRTYSADSTKDHECTLVLAKQAELDSGGYVLLFLILKDGQKSGSLESIVWYQSITASASIDVYEDNQYKIYVSVCCIHID